MIPGLLSDFFALVVLVGPLRRGLARTLFGASKPSDGLGMSAGNVNADGFKHRENPSPVTLEGDFRMLLTTAAGTSPDFRFVVLVGFVLFLHGPAVAAVASSAG